MGRLDLTPEQKQKFFDEQEEKVQKLRDMDPMLKQKDYSILDKKVEKKKPYYGGRYANFNRGMAKWKKLGD